MRCLLVDTDEMYLRGLRLSIEEAFDASCYERFHEGSLELALPQTQNDVFDLVVIGLDEHQVSAAQYLGAHFKALSAQSIVVLDEGSSRRVRELVVAGFSSFVHRSSAWGTLHRAIERTLQGQQFVDERIAPHLLGRDCGFMDRHALSPREKEVALLAANGMTNAEIARSLFLSPNTVKYHLAGVYSKTGLHNRLQLTCAVMGVPR